MCYSKCCLMETCPSGFNHHLRGYPPPHITVPLLALHHRSYPASRSSISKYTLQAQYISSGLTCSNNMHRSIKICGISFLSSFCSTATCTVTTGRHRCWSPSVLQHSMILSRPIPRLEHRQHPGQHHRRQSPSSLILALRCNQKPLVVKSWKRV